MVVIQGSDTETIRINQITESRANDTIRRNSKGNYGKDEDNHAAPRCSDEVSVKVDNETSCGGYGVDDECVTYAYDTGKAVDA
ncbi:unnamed protein product [Phytophthora fragariaefolia]|uniref:Unnamed protein product n=1 Tax=Phytophthora fragariaefolia TaxID=1490495 RepID=A0A9W6YN45_9STRA|nr:unnamed protein product [Phytophthora fragariaefolia]